MNAVPIEMPKAETDCPAIYKLRIENFPSADQEILKWGWVEVSALIESLCYIYVPLKMQIEELNLPGIFTNYGLLCNKSGNQPLLTWISQKNYVHNSTELPSPIAQQWSSIFIPAGWAKRIIAAARSRILKVTTSPWVRHGQDPFLGPFVTYQLVGHIHGEGKTIISYGGEAITTKEAPSLTHIIEYQY